MNWKQKKRKRELKGVHPSIQNRLAEVRRIIKGEKIVNHEKPKPTYHICQGTTLEGKPCKNHLYLDANGYCYHHRHQYYEKKRSKD